MAFRFPILLVALLLALPSAAATWRGYGTFEPDNNQDSSSFLFYNAPVGNPGQIYFNGWTVAWTDPSGVNPNVGTLGSRIAPAGETIYQAMLGQWTDCNGDGYVGIAEDAFEEYPSQLLTNADVCPDGSAHNNDGWVTELLWIGDNYDDGFSGPQINHDNRIIADPEVTVWADDGLYDADNSGGHCIVNAIPRGGAHTTGGLLDVADCHLARYTGVRTSSLAGATPVGPADPQNWNSPSTLNQPTFGDDSSNHAMAHTADCSQDPPNKAAWDQVYATQEADRPTSMQSGLGGTTYNLTESTFAPGPSRSDLPRAPPTNPGLNPPKPSASAPGSWDGGNVPGTVNMTFEEGPGFSAIFTSSDCNYQDDNGQEFYGTLGEAQVANTYGRLKQESDHFLNFSTQFRHQLPTPGFSLNSTTFDHVDVGGDPTPLPVTRVPIIAAIPAEQPQCLGLYAYSTLSCFQTVWKEQVAIGNTQAGPTAPDLVRADIANAQAGPSGPTYVTYFAHVATASGVIPGGHGKYGGAQCDTIGAGAAPHHGWLCDPTAWYTNADGTPEVITTRHASVGQMYELRDVDCYDGQVVAGLPVFAGSGQAGTACGDAPTT